MFLNVESQHCNSYHTILQLTITKVKESGVWNHLEVLFRLWAPKTAGHDENWSGNIFTYTVLD